MGIAVLGGFIIYIIITLVVLVIAVKSSTGKKRKWISAFWVILIAILIPTWDIPIGRIYHNYLCKTQEGQFIYKTVELGDDYLYESGEFMMHKLIDGGQNYAIAKGGELDLERVKQDYVINSNYDEDYSRWGYIYKLETTITSIQDKQVLSRAMSFFYGGGWLMASFGRAGIACPQEGVLGKNSRYSIHSNLPDKTFTIILNNGDLQ